MTDNVDNILHLFPKEMSLADQLRQLADILDNDDLELDRMMVVAMSGEDHFGVYALGRRMSMYERIGVAEYMKVAVIQGSDDE